MQKMKNDKYRKARGGKAFMIRLFCLCGCEMLHYQKDGDGKLKRCYLNRIFAPADLEWLQYDKANLDPKNIRPLICPACKKVIGMPIVHHDGRVAFRLRQGMFNKKRDVN
jgi:hypothetical protein